MGAGRPSISNPFRAVSPASWTELATVAERGRLMIPAEIRNRVAWLAKGSSQRLLAIVDPEGSVELLPWEPVGKAAIEVQEKRLEAAEEPMKGQMLVALADKFFRLSIEEPGRIGLPPALRSFLEVPGEQWVRFVASHQQLWLWNERLWQERRPTREALIS